MLELIILLFIGIWLIKNKYKKKYEATSGLLFFLEKTGKIFVVSDTLFCYTYFKPRINK